MRDYSIYRFTPKELLLAAGKGTVVILLPVWLFFHSIPVLAVSLVLVPFYIKREQRLRNEERRQRLKLEFADALGSLLAALEAGYSPENALAETVRDLKLLYKEEDMIVQEFSAMQRQIYSNQNIEDLFAEFAKRSKEEDICSFSEVFSIAKRTGGDLIRIVRATERTLAEKAEVSREIKTIISAKKLEAGIMSLMPMGILLYFMLCDPEYLIPLYEGTAGRVVMLIALAVYAGCVFAAEKIAKIHV